jgi:phosphoadenosine phosphosulfate reductase
MLDEQSVNGHIEAFAGLEGRALIAAAVRKFPKRTAVLSSFGAESAVLLHMISEVDPDLPVIFLDTGKLFPETLAYSERLEEELGLRNVRRLAPDAASLEQFDPSGELHKFDTEMCCFLRKSAPLDSVSGEFDVLISGRKRMHGNLRKDLEFVTLQDGKLKIDPLAAFSSLDLAAYAQQHQLPSHPLRLAGYRSIGCVPCTAAGGSDDDPRAGRWSGMEKTECGIHFTSNGKVIRTEVRAV